MKLFCLLTILFVASVWSHPTINERVRNPNDNNDNVEWNNRQYIRNEFDKLKVTPTVNNGGNVLRDHQLGLLQHKTDTLNRDLMLNEDHTVHHAVNRNRLHADGEYHEANENRRRNDGTFNVHEHNNNYNDHVDNKIENELNNGRELFNRKMNMDGDNRGDVRTKVMDMFELGKEHLREMPKDMISFGIHSVCTATTFMNAITRAYIPNLNDIDYVLFKKGNHMVRHRLTDMDGLMHDNDFKRHSKTVLVILGVTMDQIERNDELKRLHNAYKEQHGSHNFVVVDMHNVLKTLKHLTSLETKTISDEIANGMKKLTQHINMDKFDMIGHSIGAHIMGEAARAFRDMTGKSVKKMYGLDPTRKCLAGGKHSTTLQRDDGDFVFVMHTTMHSIGIKEQIGHVDFYPNDEDTLQPGCSTIWCSHQRAIDLMAESVHPNTIHNLKAKKCTKTRHLLKWTKTCENHDVVMGFMTPSSTRGTFFSTTHSQSPFGKQDWRSMDSGARVH